MAVCAYCRTAIDVGEPTVSCPGCDVPYHFECWEDNGGCAVYGCDQAQEVEARDPLDVPVSYWGREHKPCPKCGEEILAAALRCRQCGATFDSARPETSGEFRRHDDDKKVGPRLRKGTAWLVFFCLLTPTAPIAAIIGALWYRTHREAFKSIPSVYSGLSRLAVAVGLGQTVLIVILAGVYALTGGV